jgi:hypothetical protein
MFNKKRLFTLITVVTLLALLPTTALAATFTFQGVTVTAPDSYTSCTPSDNISVSGVGTNTVVLRFFRKDVTTNYSYLLGTATLTADGSAPFPYPAITGTMWFMVEVMVFDASGTKLGTQAATKWSVTCEPTTGGEGCTPGYWKNHLGSWQAPYTPAGSFNTAFLIGANYFEPGFFSNSYTLDQAINQGGGGLNRLARHGTAALLSAAHPDVDYPYTVAQVIALVQAGIIDPLAQANELGCPIN